MRGPAPFETLAPALALMGFGAGLVAPAMNAAILASVPRALSGIGAGVLNAARQVGTALAVAVFASFFHGRAPFDAVRLALLCAGALYLGALLLSTRAHRASTLADEDGEANTSAWTNRAGPVPPSSSSTPRTPSRFQTGGSAGTIRRSRATSPR
jgi:DHA2 family methylenomycin A resistance protein-like MFS transporter